MRLGVIVVLLTLLACRGGKPKGPPMPSAGDVCYKLAAAGVASKCQIGSRGDAGLLVRSAAERVTFDVAAAPGKLGQVLRYTSADKYAGAVSDFEAASILVGPHRYGSSKALIFVQLPKDTTADVGAKASAVVSAL